MLGNVVVVLLPVVCWIITWLKHSGWFGLIPDPKNNWDHIAKELFGLQSQGIVVTITWHGIELTAERIDMPIPVVSAGPQSVRASSFSPTIQVCAIAYYLHCLVFGRGLSMRVSVMRIQNVFELQGVHATYTAGLAQLQTSVRVGRVTLLTAAPVQTCTQTAGQDSEECARPQSPTHLAWIESLADTGAAIAVKADVAAGQGVALGSGRLDISVGAVFTPDAVLMWQALQDFAQESTCTEDTPGLHRAEGSEGAIPCAATDTGLLRAILSISRAVCRPALGLATLALRYWMPHVPTAQDILHRCQWTCNARVARARIECHLPHASMSSSSASRMASMPPIFAQCTNTGMTCTVMRDENGRIGMGEMAVLLCTVSLDARDRSGTRVSAFLHNVLLRPDPNRHETPSALKVRLPKLQDTRYLVLSQSVAPLAVTVVALRCTVQTHEEAVGAWLHLTPPSCEFSQSQHNNANILLGAISAKASLQALEQLALYAMAHFNVLTSPTDASCTSPQSESSSTIQGSFVPSARAPLFVACESLQPSVFVEAIQVQLCPGQTRLSARVSALWPLLQAVLREMGPFVAEAWCMHLQANFMCADVLTSRSLRTTGIRATVSRAIIAAPAWDVCITGKACKMDATNFSGASIIVALLQRGILPEWVAKWPKSTSMHRQSPSIREEFEKNTTAKPGAFLAWLLPRLGRQRQANVDADAPFLMRVLDTTIELCRITSEAQPAGPQAVIFALRGNECRVQTAVEVMPALARLCKRASAAASRVDADAHVPSDLGVHSLHLPHSDPHPADAMGTIGGKTSEGIADTTAPARPYNLVDVDIAENKHLSSVVRETYFGKLSKNDRSNYIDERLLTGACDHPATFPASSRAQRGGRMELHVEFKRASLVFSYASRTMSQRRVVTDDTGERGPIDGRPYGRQLFVHGGGGNDSEEGLPAQESTASKPGQVGVELLEPSLTAQSWSWISKPGYNATPAREGQVLCDEPRSAPTGRVFASATNVIVREALSLDGEQLSLVTPVCAVSIEPPQRDATAKRMALEQRDGWAFITPDVLGREGLRQSQSTGNSNPAVQQNGIQSPALSATKSQPSRGTGSSNEPETAIDSTTDSTFGLTQSTMLPAPAIIEQHSHDVPKAADPVAIRLEITHEAWLPSHGALAVWYHWDDNEAAPPAMDKSAWAVRHVQLDGSLLTATSAEPFMTSLALDTSARRTSPCNVMTGDTVVQCALSVGTLRFRLRGRLFEWASQLAGGSILRELKRQSEGEYESENECDFDARAEEEEEETSESVELSEVHHDSESEGRVAERVSMYAETRSHGDTRQQNAEQVGLSQPDGGNDSRTAVGLPQEEVMRQETTARTRTKPSLHARAPGTGFTRDGHVPHLPATRSSFRRPVIGGLSLQLGHRARPVLLYGSDLPRHRSSGGLPGGHGLPAVVVLDYEPEGSAQRLPVTLASVALAWAAGPGGTLAALPGGYSMPPALASTLQGAMHALTVGVTVSVALPPIKGLSLPVPSTLTCEYPSSLSAGLLTLFNEIVRQSHNITKLAAAAPAAHLAVHPLLQPLQGMQPQDVFHAAGKVLARSAFRSAYVAAEAASPAVREARVVVADTLQAAAVAARPTLRRAHALSWDFSEALWNTSRHASDAVTHAVTAVIEARRDTPSPPPHLPLTALPTTVGTDGEWNIVEARAPVVRPGTIPVGERGERAGASAAGNDARRHLDEAMIDMLS